MNWAWEQRLPPNSKLILMALADAADEVGQCWPRVRLIAEKCCTSERTVQRVLKELETTGYLHIERSYRKDGSQASNVYQLSLTTPPANLSPPLRQIDTGERHSRHPPVTRVAPPGDRAMSPHEPPNRTTKQPSQQQPPKAPYRQPCSLAPEEPEKGACKDLIWPPHLDEPARKAIMRMVASIDVSAAQELLDELAGVSATQSIKTRPERWFRAVLQRFHEGTFVPLAGEAIKNKRAHIKTHTTEAPKSVRTASPEVIRQHLDQIKYRLYRSQQ